MYFDKETDEEPLSVMEIQERHPLTMMPHYLERYEFIEPASEPEYDRDTQKTVSAKSEIVDGVRRQKWFVVPLNAIELAERERQREAEAAALIPKSCTRRQGRRALLARGLLDDAEALIDAMPDGLEKREAQIEYEADTWERDSPFLQQLWALLGGTPQTLDEAFVLAVTL